MADSSMKLIVVAAEDSEETLREQLTDLSGGRELELKIIAPIEPKSKLDLFTGDIDDQIDDADSRAAEGAQSADDSDGAHATKVEVGDADQLLAIEDALATFAAEQIVFVDSEGELVAEARERFELPVSAVAAK